VSTHRLVLAVALKVTDNEARSALEALRVKMGLGDAVADLVRDELWVLEIDAPSDTKARDAVARLAASTNIFANPNKHRTEIGGPLLGFDPDVLAADEVAVLVTDREGGGVGRGSVDGGTDTGGGAGAVEAARRAGFGDLTAARRWTRWRVRYSGPLLPEDPRAARFIQRIGATTGRHEGFLWNPHSQIARVIVPWGGQKPLDA
jgi:hypothetical protein